MKLYFSYCMRKITLPTVVKRVLEQPAGFSRTPDDNKQFANPSLINLTLSETFFMSNVKALPHRLVGGTWKYSNRCPKLRYETVKYRLSHRFFKEYEFSMGDFPQILLWCFGVCSLAMTTLCSHYLTIKNPKCEYWHCYHFFIKFIRCYV